jgi:protein SCO1/2
LILLLIGFAAFYLFWPQSIDLPKLGTVEEWPLAADVDDGFHEKPKLLTFFFTNCPDICPTTMSDLKEFQQLMREKGIADDRYIILSVTLDPEYDTSERINQYKELFEITSPNWLFLRGSLEETKKFTQYFNFYYEKNDDGFVTHSTSMYIVDSNDYIRAHHDMAIGKKSVNIEEIANQLEMLIK